MAGCRIRIALARLRPDAHPGHGRREATPAVRVLAGARSDVTDELDVRGQRAQDAREAVRSFVDEAALAGLPSVRVIHGRGRARSARPSATSWTATRSSTARERTPPTARRRHLQSW